MWDWILLIDEIGANRDSFSSAWTTSSAPLLAGGSECDMIDANVNSVSISRNPKLVHRGCPTDLLTYLR